jgi:hypothetical protein
MRGLVSRTAPVRDAGSPESIYRDSEFARSFGPDAPPRGVLHVVGHMTEAVFDVLGPTCAALEAEGRQQALMVLHSEGLERFLSRLSAQVVVHVLPARSSFPQTWLGVGRALETMVSEGRWQALYLHGLMPLAIAAPVLKLVRRGGGRVLLSPHSSRSLRSMRWLGLPVLWGIHRWMPLAGIQTIASVPFEVRALRRMARISARLIEPPVDDVFFSVATSPEESGLMLAGGASGDAKGAVQRFAQLTVLLAEALPKARYCWVTAVSDDERALLAASGVEVLAAPDDPYARAQALSQARFFLCTGLGRGFGMILAEAMAVGLPCLSVDDPAARDLLTQEETGLLYPDVQALASGCLRVLADPSEQARLSEQARREAVMRFSDQEFRRHILAMLPRATRSSEPRPLV